MQCHTPSQTDISLSNGSIALVGHPNVGKSVIFQRLTGQHVIVSNYPGTTIEVTRGSGRQIIETVFVDTPGVITFPSRTEDEQVTARLLLHEPLRAILQVGDAKNLRRTLLLTIQLLEMGRPVVMALNMMDEAEAHGMAVDDRLLAQYLGIPVILTTATRGRGIDELTEALRVGRSPQFTLQYDASIETAIAQICALISENYQPAPPIACRSLALLWFSRDPETERWLKESLPTTVIEEMEERREALQISFHEPLSAVVQGTRLTYVEQLASSVILSSGQGWQGISTTLSRLTTHPVWGVFILVGVLYALYWFVGVFGAGTLVGLLEENLFAGRLNPWVTGWVERLIPVPVLAELLVGDYGLWTMGMTYALALILPIVTTFFLAFGIMEDSGYLPRLAALSNRLFQFLGLNGKAVLPMVLGLGCVTMATLTTRVLESKRERLLVTLLLALAIPCSAQLGVVLGLLAGISLTATLIWSGVVSLILLAIGWLAAHLMPGERNRLLVEMPPMRFPMFSNVLIKTLARLEWYLKEVIPLFLVGTALLFILDKSKLLDSIIRFTEPLVTGWLGLPAETSAAFLLGFLRRDFGATGLFVMESQGLLSPLQVVVAMVTITLFIPCMASVMMIAKERGWKTATGMMVFIFPLAFLVGGLLNRVLLALGWGL